MQIDLHGNVSLMYFEQLRGCSALAHAVTLRTAPADTAAGFDLGWTFGRDPAPVRRRVASVADALGLDFRLVCGCTQVHGCRIVRIDEVPPVDRSAPWRMCGECDALVTNLPGITLLVRVADCVPIVLYDPVCGVVAVVHAGWKGTLAGIASAAAQEMASRYGSRPCDLLSGIGPSIGPCCFEVGDDVAAQFRAGFDRAGRCMMMNCRATTINLPEANRLQLLDSGVPPDSIEVAGMCTSCRSDIFFSHRGEQGKTGRFGLFAGLRA